MHNGHLGATISILFDKRPVGSDAWNDLSPSAEGEEEETGATVACLPLPFHLCPGVFASQCYFAD